MADLCSLAFSSSYLPARDSREGQVLLARLSTLSARHAIEGQVTRPYCTLAVIGRPSA